MSRKYDSRTTIFSPEGRLLQVEYAIKAINHAGLCVGIAAVDGIVLLCQRKTSSKLLDNSFPEKIFRISDEILCAVAGVTSDANVLIQRMRDMSQTALLTYNEPIPVETLVSDVCYSKQRYTQIGGYRPFGVSFLYAGWDTYNGFQLYQCDPSGNYSGWNATCIGKGSDNGSTILQDDYVESITVNEACSLALKVYGKNSVEDEITKESVEMAILSMVDGKIHSRMLSFNEIRTACPPDAFKKDELDSGAAESHVTDDVD